MEANEYSVGLDIGTTKIVAIVGRRSAHGKIEVMGVGKSKSLGVRKGIVHNIAHTISSIKAAISEAEKSAKVPIKKVTVGIAGKHIRSLQHTDYIGRQDPESYITEVDISKLKEQVKKIAVHPGEEIIHVLPQEYKVDSEEEIIEPIGMHGTRLEAKFHVVVGQMASIKNVVRCVKEAGLELEALTLEPLASAEAVLTQEEKEAGVAIVDIGGGTTDVAVFKDNIIRHTCVIPYGGGIITEDIKEGCSIIEKHAEQLKINFGSAVPDLEKENAYVTIPGLHGREEKEISLKSLAGIISARVEEILEMVNNELKSYGAYEMKSYGVNEQKRKLIAGMVLTGGGSNLRNLRQLANYVTGFDCRIGYANEYIINDKNQLLRSPEYSTAIGLLMESLRINEKQENIEIERKKEEVSKPVEEVAPKPVEKQPETVSTKEVQEEPKKEAWSVRFMKKFKNFFEEEEN